MERLIFSDEDTLHICNKPNRSDICIWETEHPHAMIYINVILKMSTFFVLCPAKMCSPFFFHEATVLGNSVLNMFENWLLPKLNSNYDIISHKWAEHLLIFIIMYKDF